MALHGTFKQGKEQAAGLVDNPDKAWLDHFARRGYVVIAPDHFTAGHRVPSEGPYETARFYAKHPEWTAVGKFTYEHSIAIDVLQSLPEVDPDKIGVLGHSLGGHNTLFVSAFDERIKVAVTSCGFTRFAKYYNGDLTGWTHKGYMPRIDAVYGKDPARMPFDFPDILASLAPRYVFINAPTRDANFDVDGVKESVDAAKKIFAIHKTEEHIVAVHPDCEHDFPPEIREQAYAFIDKALKR